MSLKKLQQTIRDFAPGFEEAEIKGMTETDLISNLHDQYDEMDADEPNAMLWEILKKYCYNCGRENITSSKGWLGPTQPLCQSCINGDFGD